MSAPFPPPYTVRQSSRAKRITLRIRPVTGLELVVPKESADSDYHKILTHFRPWIEKHYPRVMAGAAQDPETTPRFPPGFFVRGGAEFISLTPAPPTPAMLKEYAGIMLPARSMEVLAPSGDLRLRTLALPLFHQPEAPARTFRWLKEWLRAEASRELEPELRTLADTHNLHPQKFSLRFQKSRWGSCSAKGNISVNAHLLFLPPAWARYILVHELCHLKELNHSKNFWRLVFAMEPRAMEYEKALRRAKHYIPLWALG